MWQGNGTNGILTYCWWEGTWIRPFWKIVWQYLPVMNTCISSDPTIPLLAVLNRDANICSPKDTYKNVHNSAIYRSKEPETSQMSTNPRMKKQIVVILFSHENEWPTTTCNDTQNTQKRSQKQEYILHDLIYMKFKNSQN